MATKEVKYKVVKSGNIVELISVIVPKGVCASKKSFNSEIKREYADNNKIRLDNIYRTKSRLKRLLRSNKDLKTFLTLTYKENRLDLKVCNKEFNNFIKRVKRDFPDFKYIAVPEFQKRGAVHYHLVCNLVIPEAKNIPQLFAYERQFSANYWRYGFIKVKSLYGGRIDLYLAKYLTKDLDNRLFSHRKYLYSQNCKKPIILTGIDCLDIINYIHKYLNRFYKLIFKKHVVSQFMELNYYQYELLL
jgi:hypothetical protein